MRISFSNALPATHIFPFDTTIPGNDKGARQDRAAIHLHVGLVPWPSDGGPFHWAANPANAGAAVGASVIKWLPDSTGALTDDYWYPNNQSARLMWYHDHAIGITRTNAYAGLASGYVLLDDVEKSMLATLTLGEPLVIQDKIFWDPAADPSYTQYVPGALPGDLWYPVLYDTRLFKWNKALAIGGQLPVPSTNPEFFGDTMLVNGLVFPYHDVNAGMYRFRLLNACDSRFVNLRFVVEDPLIPGEPAIGQNGLDIAKMDAWLIGTEGGFLPVPVKVAGKRAQLPSILLAPAERAESSPISRKWQGRKSCIMTPLLPSRQVRRPSISSSEARWACRPAWDPTRER